MHRLALLEAVFLRRALSDLHLSKAGSETLSPQFFPRRYAAPRERFAPKNYRDRVLHFVAAKRFRSVLADARSGIARGTVLEAKPNGEYHDCNRIRDQTS
jgi:hypothetical protein